MRKEGLEKQIHMTQEGQKKAASHLRNELTKQLLETKSKIQALIRATNHRKM